MYYQPPLLLILTKYNRTLNLDAAKYTLPDED